MCAATIACPPVVSGARRRVAIDFRPGNLLRYSYIAIKRGAEGSGPMTRPATC
jgi:hypothetical protein